MEIRFINMAGMRLCRAAVLTVLLALLVPILHAEGPDDQYIAIYNLIQEGDVLTERSESRQALAKYLDAQAALQRFQKGFPEWSTDVVKFRLEYLAGQIATLSVKVQGVETNAPTTPAPARKPAPPDWEIQVNALKQQLVQTGQEKAVLEAKLKESMAAQPAAVDPRELAKAQERLASLQKENDLLNATLAQERSKPPQVDTNAVSKVQRTLDEANRELAEEKKATEKSQAEKEQLQNRLKAALNNPVPDTNALNALQQSLAGTNRQLAEQKELVAKLTTEKDALQSRLKTLAADAESLAKVQQALTAANKELVEQKDLVAKLTLEKSAIQSKLRTPASEPENVAVLRARIDALEAQKVPYSPEELALMKMPEPTLATNSPAKAASQQSPSSVASLTLEAQRLFAAKDYEQAKQKYLMVLKERPDNPVVLSNLAVIETKLNHLDEAETYIRKALTFAPDDVYNLAWLGTIKLKQGQKDEAIDVLSHAAKVDPRSAEVQSRLGMALSEKGLRGPAEAALRKALELQPGYASAHQNLAVIYATQDPPLLELARWHYLRAVAGGEPKDPDFEKRLKKSP